MKGFIAKKVGMTRVVDEEGRMIPVTLLYVEDQKVTKILTPERDGYHGLQIGYYSKSEHKLTKPDVARLRKVNIQESFTRFKEFRLSQAEEGLEIGHVIALDVLTDVESVDVTGVTKGHGFEGSITRWGHKTGRRTHGSHFHRRPGSLGQRTTPGRVFKNKGMPGHMGNVSRTAQNLSVVDVDAGSKIIAVRGSVPGSRNSYVVVKPSVKSKSHRGQKRGKR